MQDNIMDMFTQQSKMLFAPITKYNGLLVENLEKMTQFQLDTIKAYSEMSLGQMKKASAVQGVDGLREFTASQAEMGAAINKRIVEDAKALSDMALEFKSKMEALFNESLKTAAETKPAPVKKAS